MIQKLILSIIDFFGGLLGYNARFSEKHEIEIYESKYKKLEDSLEIARKDLANLEIKRKKFEENIIFESNLLTQEIEHLVEEIKLTQNALLKSRDRYYDKSIEKMSKAVNETNHKLAGDKRIDFDIKDLM